jgi:hypothetical protein
VDDTGVWAVRTEPPELAQIVGRSQSVGFSANVSLSEGYICSARGPIGGMQIVDVDPVTSAKVVGSIDPADSSGGGWYNNDVSASGGYAYVAGASFDVIDIDPAGSAQIVATMELPNPGVCVEYSGGYAYVIRSGIFYTLGRLMIMDVSSPLTPVIAGQVGVSGANDIAVVGEYGYIASGETGLKILDLEPPESVHKVQEVATQDYAGGVAVDGGYAYVADGKGDLKIIDVDPVESAYIVKTVPITGEARGVAVSGGYAYVAATAGSESGIHIVDIDPPESAWVCTYFDTPGSAEDVLVSGEYAYVADGLGGLRIIRLW